MTKNLTTKQIKGMLKDLYTFRNKVINEKLNIDINVINEDIDDMEQKL